jgi:HK97 family phage portal protein
VRERPRGLFGAFVAGAGYKTDILDYLPPFMMDRPVKSGQLVSYDTALSVTTILACCVVRANGLAQVPWRVMQALPGGRGARYASEHPLNKLLNRKPNDDQTSFEYRETIALHLALARNHYSFISRGVGGKILELIPLEPARVEHIREGSRTVGYWVTGEDGRRVRLAKDEIWHIRGLSWNGWKGMDAVKLAAEAIGLSLALEESHARLHANGVQTSGTWSVDGKLTEDQHKKLTAWIKRAASGFTKFDPLIVDNGAKWLAQQMSGVDAEHLATRQFQVIEDCRAMNVQPMMIFALDKPTYNSAEQLQIAHVVHTMAPEYERIEQSADVHLLGVEDDTAYYTHFDEKKLLRGSLKDRGDFLAKIAGGAGGSRPLMTQDEARDDLDLPPMGGSAAQLLEPIGAVANPANAANPKPDDIEDPA